MYVSAAVVLVCMGLRLAAPVVVPVLLALFIAIVTAPIVIWLCDRGYPRSVAVAAGLLLDMAAGAALGFPLAAAVSTFISRLPRYQYLPVLPMTDCRLDCRLSVATGKSCRCCS